MTPKASVNSSAISQPVATPLTRAAIFLVVTVNPGAENRVVIRHLCKDLSSLVRSAGFRELEGSLSCVMAVGSETWDRLFGQPRPAELRKFREIHAGERHAPSTPGDLLFHIRAQRLDLCFELDDSVKPTFAHNALTKITKDGAEIKILRDNMPFGQAARGEFGTYFIGYSRSPRTIEEMLQNMFVGNPPGNYDRLLDFSRAVTGNLFFVPSATFLENLTSAPA